MLHRPTVPDSLREILSQDALESILLGETSGEERAPRTLEFVWVWFSDEQLSGPEMGNAIDLASSHGGFVEVFPPIAAFWFGHFEEIPEGTRAQVVEGLRPLAAGGARIVHGKTTGSPRNVGSASRLSYTVLTPDRSRILVQLAAAAEGSVDDFDSGERATS